MGSAQALDKVKQAVPLSDRQFAHAASVVIERLKREIDERSPYWLAALDELTHLSEAQRELGGPDPRKAFRGAVMRYYRAILIEKQLAGQEPNFPQTQEEWDRLPEWRVA